MNVLRLKTNLRCAACIQSITPLFDADPAIEHWSADGNGPDKILTIEGTNISRESIDALLRAKGYAVTGAVEANDAPSIIAMPSDPPTSYYPLILIVSYILGATLLVEASHGIFVAMRAMNHFMAGFFLVFSFFKLLDLRAFADAYRTYDVVARRFPAYGLAYPFIELILGILFLTGTFALATNVATLIVMAVSTVGVVQTLVAGRKIRCACLGAVFNLPMSIVTLVEVLLMVAMAGIMIAMLTHSK